MNYRKAIEKLLNQATEAQLKTIYTFLLHLTGGKEEEPEK